MRAPLASNFNIPVAAKDASGVEGRVTEYMYAHTSSYRKKRKKWGRNPKLRGMKLETSFVLARPESL